MLTTTNKHTNMVCARCEHPVYKSDNPEYSYQCFNCDEDLYSFEVKVKTEESQMNDKHLSCTCDKCSYTPCTIETYGICYAADDDIPF